MKDTTFGRYSRQIFIDEVSVKGQRKIMSAKVLVIGAGGLGSPVLQYLAVAGVGKLAVVDFDKVELHNLNRQVIHEETSIGHAKVQSAKKRITEINSSIDFITYEQKLTRDNIDSLFPDFDIIVDCTDNFETRYLINDTCVRLNLPLVYGSIFRFEGQLAVFNYQKSKNLRDIFPDAPTDVPDCDAAGVLGPLPGVIGSMMAMEVLKIILGFEVMTNRILVINTLNWNFSILRY